MLCGNEFLVPAVSEKLCWRMPQHPVDNLACIQASALWVLSLPFLVHSVGALLPCQSSRKHWHFCVRGLALILLLEHRGADGAGEAEGEAQGGFSLSLLAVSRFVKYTGYGNAAGLLAARGLMAGGREEGEYSEDEDTDTEEYKEAKPK